MRKAWMIALAVLVCGVAPVFGGAQAETAAEEGPTQILWWSHWANEPAKVQAVEKVAEDYEAANPDVDIEIVWWDKNPLREAFRAAMTAGSEAPDIVTLDTDLVGQYADAGWIAPIDLPEQNMATGAIEDGTWDGELYKLNIGKNLHMVLYNPQIMSEIGASVPDNNQMTSAAFLDAVKKASAAGYSGAANAIGNRPYPAEQVVQFLATTFFDSETWRSYWVGEQSWDTPQMREILNYVATLTDNGFWPESFSTMTIDEYHVYFHTQRKALTLWIPTWYTGRAFKPESEGGQDPDWQMGMMLYPRLPGAVQPRVVSGGWESGYGVSTANPDNLETARDIISFFAQPKYGAAWEAYTASPSAIKNSPSDKPAEVPESQWGWYTDKLGSVYGELPVVVTSVAGQSGDLKAAIESNINQGIPLGLVTVDEAIRNINEAAGQ